MRQYRTLLFAAALVSLMLLVGCGEKLEPTPTPLPAEQLEQAVDRAELIGSFWQVDSFGSADDSLGVLPDTKLTLSMMLARYAGYDGCNWFMGVYEVNGKELTFDTPAITSFICEDEDISAQSATYYSSLVNTTEYKIEDDNLITFTVGEQKMATFVPAEPVAIEGTAWSAKFVNDGDDMTAASNYDYTVSALFQDGKVTGNGGCNDYEADYTVDGSHVTITNLESGTADCSKSSGADEVEEWFFSALQATDTWGALVTSMIFSDADGNPQILFGTP